MAVSDPQPSTGLPKDLGPRLVSGVILGLAALMLTWINPWTFACLVIAVGLIVAWEWGRIVRKAEQDAILIVHLVSVLAAGLLSATGLPMLGMLSACVGAIIAGILGFDKLGRVSALGVLYAAFPVVSLIWIRNGAVLGVQAALFLLLCVWASDTGAYFAGRGIGGPKLVPSISPNKTWSGAAGGMVASLLVATGFKFALPALGWQPLLVGAALLAVISQAGDLMESGLKRWYGVKDASGLIPGHGGFMDRVDGLIFAAIAAALFAVFVNVHAPGRAILTWT